MGLLLQSSIGGMRFARVLPAVVALPEAVGVLIVSLLSLKK
jgi:hypothetical protein